MIALGQLLKLSSNERKGEIVCATMRKVGGGKKRRERKGPRSGENQEVATGREQ